MEYNTAAIQVLIALIGIIGSGLSVFIGLKVALAESKKDILFYAKEIERLEEWMEKHIDPISHPSKEQIRHLQQQLQTMSRTVEVAHTKIEAKIDKAGDKLETKIDAIMDRIRKTL